MSFAREGIAFLAVAAAVAAGMYALALNRRSWPLWLLAYALTIVALWVAYFFRDAERTDSRGTQLVIAPALGELARNSEASERAFIGGGVRRVSNFMKGVNVHVNR